jgi:hypothetical protein
MIFYAHDAPPVDEETIKQIMKFLRAEPISPETLDAVDRILRGLPTTKPIKPKDQREAEAETIREQETANARAMDQRYRDSAEGLGRRFPSSTRISVE